MSLSLDSSTRLSFLANLSDSQNRMDVWPLFVDSYGKAIYYWGLKWGASPADAEDMAQQTLLTVFLKIEQFRHGGKFTFRAWLKQIARYTWMNIYEKASRTDLLPVEDVDRIISLQKLKTSAAREDLIHCFDQLACEEIRDLAFTRVRERVSEQTWEIFLLFEHQGQSGEGVAQQFDVSTNTVRMSVYRVRQLLNEEVKRIDPTFDESL